MDSPLTRFWDDTRLRATAKVSAPSTPARGRLQVGGYWTAVTGALCVGYGERSGAVITKGRTVMRARTTPSAGALYPFEVLVAFRGRGRYELYQYQVVGTCLRRLAAISDADMAALTGPLDGASGPPVAVVAIVGRPALSMRKYGPRGYLYTCLDMGHAATNLFLAAEDAGFAAAVRLRFDRAAAAKVLGLERRGWQPHSLITLHEPADAAWSPVQVGNPFAVPIWRHDVAPDADESSVDDREATAALRAVNGDDVATALAPAPGVARSVTAEDATFDGAGTGGEVGLPAPVARWANAFHRVALRRQSAKGFVAEPIDADVLAHALHALTVGTRVDCADGPALGLRVLARRVDGVPGGVFGYASARHALRPVLAGDCAGDAVVAACMNQEVVRSAAAVLALHAPARPLLGRFGQQGLAELHFHAACAAQRLCLGAAENGLGITCLGGFDATAVAGLMRLEPPQEVIYVIAVGVPDESAVKWDRAPIAYSHGTAPAGPSADTAAQQGAPRC